MAGEDFNTGLKELRQTEASFSQKEGQLIPSGTEWMTPSVAWFRRWPRDFWKLVGGRRPSFVRRVSSPSAHLFGTSWHPGRLIALKVEKNTRPRGKLEYVLYEVKPSSCPNTFAGVLKAPFRMPESR